MIGGGEIRSIFKHKIVEYLVFVIVRQDSLIEFVVSLEIFIFVSCTIGQYHNSLNSSNDIVVVEILFNSDNNRHRNNKQKLVKFTKPRNNTS